MSDAVGADLLRPRETDAAARLNRDCLCLSLDRARLRHELAQGPCGPELLALIERERPHLFADVGVFVDAAQVRAMAEIVGAVERVVALPAWRAHVMAHAPQIARADPGCAGVFLGYDFHLVPGGVRLIEINTNAGGGLLNALLARAQQTCCASLAAALAGSVAARGADEVFFAMFLAEWRAARGEAPLRTVAIVDEAPAQQYLYPEFLLFRRMFERHGLRALICDPRELSLERGRLTRAGEAIDLVYNRLTDFAFDTEPCRVLRAAHLDGAALVTPHPHAHALYADKRNLVALSDDALLADWGVAAADRAALHTGVPRTVAVAGQDPQTLWEGRREWFFKPAGGVGSRAAYRGDKLTRRVFDQIVAAGDYVAQRLAPPSQRDVAVGGVRTGLKLDLRNYVYRGQVQLVAARLYQGQTTNFRTPGGGFAPVLAVAGTPMRLACGAAP